MTQYEYFSSQQTLGSAWKMPRSLLLDDYFKSGGTDQLTGEHLAERTVRATVHARRTIMAGYTSVRYDDSLCFVYTWSGQASTDHDDIPSRDLGTEGAADADIALRKCLSGVDAIIPGPRYFCANRAIVTTGSYGTSNKSKRA